MTNNEIEVMIDLARIPASVGEVQNNNGKQVIHIKSITALQKWIVDKITPGNHHTSFVVTGPMSNCVALQIGLWLAGRGEIFYQTSSGYRFALDVRT